MSDEPKVSAEETKGEVAEQATQSPAQSVAEGSATQASNQQVDAEAFRKEAEQLKKDINQMKASFQKREAKIESEAKNRVKQLEEALEAARVQSMDDEARKAYEATRGSKRVTELETELAQLKEQQATADAFRGAVEQFRDAGVPLESLVTDADLPALVESGWNWMTSHMRELEEKVAKASTKKEPEPLPTPPAVPGAKGAPASKTTWADLEKQYGSRETVFALVEQGRLSPDILP